MSTEELSQEAVEEFRSFRLMNINTMLSDVGSVALQTDCKEEDILLLRRELLDKKRKLESKILAKSPLDEEERDLIRMIEEAGYEDD